MNNHSPATLLLLLLLLSSLLTLFNITNVSSLPAQPSATSCYNHDKDKIKRVDCLFVTRGPKYVKNQAGNDKMIKFNITCNFPNKVGFCDKVAKNLDTTAKIISDIIKF